MDQTRRRMLGALGWGIAMAGMPGPGRAQDRLRILPPSAPPSQVAGPPSLELRGFLAGLRTGEARASKGLTVLWLHGKDRGTALEIATLEEARGRGDVVITERDQASVPELIVENRGATSVLLLAGEVLVGGKQNRVLREDVLLPPHSGPRAIGVYCVEAGRWTEGRTDFEPRGAFAAPRLRSQVLAKADQRRVWQAVDEYARAAAAPSPTQSYQALYDQPALGAHQREVETTLDASTAPASIGAAAFTGDTLLGIDAFAGTSLFARCWPKLLRAHAIETYRHPTPATPSEATLRGRVDDLIGRAMKADGARHTNAGAGHIVELQLGTIRGAALLAARDVIHVAML